MSIAAILSMVLPFVLKIGGNVFERVFSNGVTSLQGTVAGAAVFGVLTQAHCDLNLLPAALLGGIAALPGLLATDANKQSTPLIPAVKEVYPDPNVVNPMNP